MEEELNKQFFALINETINIYDLMALCFMYVWEYDSEEQSWEVNDETAEIIDGIMGTYLCFAENMGIKKAMNILKINLKEQLFNKFSFEYSLAIIYWIDDNIESDLGFSGLEENRSYVYSSLNKCNTDKIKIVPTIYAKSLVGKFAEQKEGESEYTVLRKFEKTTFAYLSDNVNNYIIWDYSLLSRYDFDIVRLDPYTNSFIKRMKENKKINIAIYPTTKESLDKYFDMEYKGRSFYIKGVKDDTVEDELKERYKKIMEEYKGKSQKADFIVFPEMLMTACIRNEVFNEHQYDGVLVCGSVWKDRKNVSSVLDRNKNEIFHYEKKNPFIKELEKREYKEGIERENIPKKYSVMEIEGVGRIGVCICKDLMDDGVFQFHSIMETTILLVPMYSQSLELQRDAKSYSMKRQGIVVAANSCSAMDDTNNSRDIGFVSLPAKKNNTNEFFIHKYDNKSCIKDCKSSCCGKYVELDFNDIEIINNTKTIRTRVRDFK